MTDAKQDVIQQIIAISMCGLDEPLWETRQKVEAELDKWLALSSRGDAGTLQIERTLVRKIMNFANAVGGKEIHVSQLWVESCDIYDALERAESALADREAPTKICGVPCGEVGDPLGSTWACPQPEGHAGLHGRRADREAKQEPEAERESLISERDQFQKLFEDAHGRIAKAEKERAAWQKEREAWQAWQAKLIALACKAETLEFMTALSAAPQPVPDQEVGCEKGRSPEASARRKAKRSGAIPDQEGK